MGQGGTVHTPRVGPPGATPISSLARDPAGYPCPTFSPTFRLTQREVGPEGYGWLGLWVKGSGLGPSSPPPLAVRAPVATWGPEGKAQARPYFLTHPSMVSCVVSLRFLLFSLRDCINQTREDGGRSTRISATPGRSRGQRDRDGGKIFR